METADITYHHRAVRGIRRAFIFFVGRATVQHQQRGNEEHHQQSDLFQKIAGLSHDYTSPEEADGTLQDSLHLLKEFELKLHQHLHLENNILFPKALKLEKELTV